MCGIFGLWHRDGKPVDLVALRRATTVLRHRGPDDEGYLLADTRSGRVVLCGGVNTAPELGLPNLEQMLGERFDLAFGFRRLSILDLSAAGHQPMASHDKRYWLIFNGEVYNYLELRSELAAHGHEFHTSCDTEVILAAYAQWGPECLRHFNGMWGLAIWDVVERQLFLARDRFGVKPLYMAQAVGGTLAFASEIKALLASQTVSFKPSPLAVAGYVAQGRFPSHQHGNTFFEGVTALPGAHYALISQRGGASRRYWSLPRQLKDAKSSINSVRERYAELFTDSVRLRLRADVPVGTCLSGGLDSSSIVAVAGDLMRNEHAVSLERLGEHQQTFSAVYSSEGPWDERAFIDRVLSRTGAAGNYVFPTGDRLWNDMERLVWHQDEPFQSTSIFAQWCVMDLARRRGATVLLDGQGADEVLGGYRPFATRFGELLKRGNLPQAVKMLRDVQAVTGVNPIPLLARAIALQLPGRLLMQLRGTKLRQAVGESYLASDVGEAWLSIENKDAMPYGDQRSLNTHLARLVLEDSLPNLLRYEDRNSMAFSIEARVPFLDYRLVEYVFAQAGEWRIHEGWTKWLQRVAVQDLLPSEVVWRRDKVGFETPERQWLREGQPQLLDILSDDHLVGQYLDLPTIRKQLPSLLAQPGNEGRIWRWANLALWLRCFSAPTR
jgi:asparagine synthase (glutamine-hydrolysing)